MWGLPIRGNSNTLQVHSRLCADKECLQQQVVIDNLTDDAFSKDGSVTESLLSKSQCQSIISEYILFNKQIN